MTTPEDSHQRVFDTLRRIPFEQLSVPHIPEISTAHNLLIIKEYWKDEGGWDFEAFKEEYEKRCGRNGETNNKENLE